MSETFRQPDGDEIQLEPVQAGDDSWFRGPSGFTAVRIPLRYEYAVRAADGGLKASGIELGSVDPRQSALPTNLLPTAEFLQQRRADRPPGFVPPSPHPVEAKGAEGKLFQLNLKGSGAYWWYEDEHGYSVVTVPERFEYALRGPEGRLMPCGILVGRMNPAEAGLKPGIQPGQPTP